MPTAVDVGRELKRLRTSIGETQAQSAQAIGVSRANLAQWEAGRYLPSELNARQLDEHFRAGNALLNLTEAARSPHGQARPAVASANILETAGSLADVFHQVGSGLLTYLIRDEQGKPAGWRHNLQSERPIKALSTAYGIKAMLMVGEPYIDFQALADSLFDMRSADGLWLGRLGSPRPETTATVLDALFRIGTSMSVDEAIAVTEHSLDDFSRTRPYLLSTVLSTVLRLRPDGPLADELTRDLLATRLDFDGVLLWPEKNEAGLAKQEPSVAHTARAVVTLREALRFEDRDDVREAVDQAIQWLVELSRPDDGLTEELIRPVAEGPGTTRILIRHFTSTWVVQALSGAAAHIPVARLHSALRLIWERYDHDLGLWAWGNGDLPIWMTLDSVTALRAVALATATPPVSPPGDRGST